MGSVRGATMIVNQALCSANERCSTPVTCQRDSLQTRLGAKEVISDYTESTQDLTQALEGCPIPIR